MPNLFPIYFLCLFAELGQKIAEDVFPVVVVDVHLLRVFFPADQFFCTGGLAIFRRGFEERTLTGSERAVFRKERIWVTFLFAVLSLFR